ncbi:hypothetical protein UC35_05025 [Ramlibacter tataouinensis]|uniref:DUF2917 domain-containing protein n=1 Tax=Ramlibacter tataouinensis TaxID=94132 RepID=A0A127JQZ6_9BURK|nr:hypothetical protein UC35_05025 [Ramlibacter tataouinensis]
MARESLARQQRIHEGATLVLPRPAGISLICATGTVWITHDGDCKDVVLEAGESYTSERRSRMLVYGLTASSVLLR